MSFTDTVTVQYSAGGATAVQTQFSATGVGRAAYSGSIPDTTSSAGQEVDIAFTYTEITQCFLLSTQALTIHVNDDGSPDQTVTLVANVPVLANPFTHNTTKLYLRNGSMTTAAIVTIILLIATSSS